MSYQRTIWTALLVAWVAVATGCGTSLSPSDPADWSLPDGFDPSNPSIERATLQTDFTGIRTIRIELPRGQVSVSQADGNTQAVLKVTELITKGLSYDDYRNKLSNSAVTAQRSFVDDTRLDIQASIAEGLADTDIVFFVRLVIPRGANIEIFLDSGPIEIHDLTGSIEARTANGPLNINLVTGNIIAETNRQPIAITDVTGNVSASTEGADITLRLTPPANGRISATTIQGKIQLTIPKSTAATMELLALEGGVVNANLSGFVVSDIVIGGGDMLSGVLNGGGGEIKATATGGEVTLVGM